MRKKVSHWKVLGGGWARLPLGHFGPGVVRGRLSSISPFAFKAFMLSLACLCLCFAFLSCFALSCLVFVVVLVLFGLSFFVFACLNFDIRVLSFGWVVCKVLVGSLRDLLLASLGQSGAYIV